VSAERSVEELTWSARSVRPVIAVYVGGVFLAFMALAFFVFESVEAVKALFLAAVGSLVALVPNIITRIEYRLSGSGLEKRRLKGREPGGFEELFSWEELSYVTPTRSGFKFYKSIGSTHLLTRLLKLHFFSGYSGEFHVESDDMERVCAVMEQHRVPLLFGPRRNHGT
jgi:hypothetical protein